MYKYFQVSKGVHFDSRISCFSSDPLCFFLSIKMRAQRILRSIPGQCPFVVRLISRKDGISAMKIEGQMRIPSGCAISAVISKEGNKMSGKMITESMKPMHDRSNGLGGGFAG